MRRGGRYLFWCSAAAATLAELAFAPTVHAQAQSQSQTEADDQAPIDDGSAIVVTAQFRKQDVQDAPLAITAINSQLMEARGYTRVSDITAQAPSVLLQPNPSGQGNSMRAFIRGVGQADQSPSVEPGVGIYVDDVYFATVTGSIFELLDLDRVEILRGPQGTLSGMNSEGGSVKLYSRRPSASGGFVEATAGSLNQRAVRASADFAIVPDHLSMRISGLYRERDGYVKSLDYACTHPDDPYVLSGALKRETTRSDCVLGEQGDQDVKAMRGYLAYDSGSGVQVDLIADWTKDDSSTQPSVLLQSGEVIPGVSLAYQGVPYDNRFVPYGEYSEDTAIHNRYVNYADYNDPGVTYEPIDVAGDPGKPNGPMKLKPASTLDSWGGSGKISIDLSDRINLVSITGYRSYSSSGTSDNDLSPVAMLLNDANFHHRQFSEEARLNGSFADNTVNVTVGGIYFHQDTIYQEQVDAPLVAGIYGPPDKPTFNFIQRDEAVMRNVAGFAHVTWDVTDQLSLAGGIRVTNENKDYTFYRLALDGVSPFVILSDPANPLNGKTGNYSGTIVDYRANVSYKFNRDIMGYVQFATGFKGGGISPRPYFPQQVRGFGPEKVKSYEVGLKSDLADHRLRLNLAAYYMDYDDYQATPQVCVDENGDPLPLPYGTPGLCGQYLNVADATVKGFEAELSAEPVDHLTIDGSLSYIDFKFGTPKIATGEVVAGSTPPGLSPWKWSAGIQYEANVLGGTLTPRLDVSYLAGYCGDLACDPIASNDGYTLANARLTYRSPDRNWSVALEVSNLFDKYYFINKFVSSYALGQPGAPREWSLTVRRNF